MVRLCDLPPSHVADMHFVYGVCNGNARAAVEEYRRRYPDRPVLGYRSFIAVHRRFCERGLFPQQNEPSMIVDVDVEEEVLRLVRANPMISIRLLSIRVGIPRVRVWRILKKEGLHPYHFRRAQHLGGVDYGARSVFCNWILAQQRANINFMRNILWTDEATFTRAGITNHRNLHVWATENPHAIRETTFQTQFSINVWAGMIDDELIGPFVLPNRLDQHAYLDFLQNTLPLLLEDVPLETRRRMQLQLDGAPAHFARIVRDYLNENYPRWIGRGGPIAWPPRSPDLTPLDFYLWGYIKQKVYAMPIENREQLITRMFAAAAEIKENRAELRRTTKSVAIRALVCLQEGGGHFENLIN